MTNTFVVDRHDLHRTRWVAGAATPLDDGGVRLTINAVALTSNNITYATFGDAMGYWSFFPTGDVATGCVPAWGYATVAESRCDGIQVGERFYGFLPMATEVVMHPVKVQDSGFVDGAAHRRELHPVYNQYLRCSVDPGYRAAGEAEQALLRPLFTTSFLIDDMLADNDFFGARTVVLSSASSKTAYGTAFCLAQRRGHGNARRVVGLTSPGNVEFTQGLGCYDEVLSYDELIRLPSQTTTVYVDFSGSAAVRRELHSHLGDALAYSCSVGGTHWDALGSGKGLPGVRPVLFFAPAQIKKRVGDWGAAGLQQRLADAWSAFIASVNNAQRPWLVVVPGRGPKALESTYAALLAGTVTPLEGHFITLAD
jgi:hypothetical protein